MPDRFPEIIEQQPAAVVVHPAVKVEDPRRHPAGLTLRVSGGRRRLPDLMAQMAPDSVENDIIRLGFDIPRPLGRPRRREKEVGFPDWLPRAGIDAGAERMILVNQSARHGPQPDNIENIQDSPGVVEGELQPVSRYRGVVTQGGEQFHDVRSGRLAGLRHNANLPSAAGKIGCRSMKLAG